MKKKHQISLQPKLSSKAWLDLESFTGEKYPPCIKKFLIAAGYNKLLALSEMDNEKLHAVESFINENRELVTDTKCCYSDMYKKQEIFSFLPGHKATILGIAEQVKRFKEHLETVPQHKASKPKKIQSEAQLKTALVNRLAAYSTKLDFTLPTGSISVRNIHNFKEEM